MNYAILRISKIKSMSAFQGIERHNMTNRQNLPHRLHPEKEKENKYFLSPAYHDSLVQTVQESIADCSRRRTSVLGYEIVCAFSPSCEYLKKQPFLDAWAAASMEWASKSFGGANNVIACYLHADESCPHLHMIVLPITADRRLCAREFTGGAKKMHELQNSYAKAVEPFGLGRGNVCFEIEEREKKYYKSPKRWWAEQKQQGKIHSAEKKRQINEMQQDYNARIEFECQKTENRSLEER